MANKWNEQMSKLLLRYSEDNPHLRMVLDEWNGFAVGEYDTRSGPKAAELFQDIAKESDDGCIILALVFYDLFQEFGEFPRKSLFDEDLYERVESVLATLTGEEKEFVDWFLVELDRRG